MRIMTQKRLISFLAVFMLLTSTIFVGYVHKSEVSEVLASGSTELVPVYDETTDTLYEITGATGTGTNASSVTWSEGKVTIPANAGANFITTIRETDSYYTSFHVKETGTTTNPQMNVRLRSGAYIVFWTGNCRIMNQAGNAKLDGDHNYPNNKKLKDGLDVTVYSDTTCMKVWIEGEKILEVTGLSTESASAAPCVTHVSNNPTEVSDIKIWTKGTRTSSAPLYDEATCDLKHSAAIYSLSANGNKDFGVTLTEEETYYVSYTLKATAQVNFEYRNKTASGWITPATARDQITFYNDGYMIAGENKVSKTAGWLKNGVNVTVCSTPEKVSIWVAGEQIAEEKQQLNEGAIGYPRISWAAGTTEVTNVKVWTKKAVTTPTYDEGTCELKHSVDAYNISANGNKDFGITLTGEETYYVSYTLKATAQVNFEYRNKTASGWITPATARDQITFYNDGYMIAGENKVSKTAGWMKNGVNVTVCSTPEKVSIWVADEKIADEKQQLTSAAIGYPRISWVSGATEVTNVKVWIEKSSITPPPTPTPTPSNVPTYNGTTDTLLYCANEITVPAGETRKFYDEAIATNTVYYVSYTVKQDSGSLWINNRDSYGRLLLQPSFWKLYGNESNVNAGLVEQSGNTGLKNGVKVTYCVKQSSISMWLGDREIISNVSFDVTGKSGKPKVNPQNASATFTDVRVWTSNEIDGAGTNEPVFDALTDYKYEISQVTAGTYENGVLTIPADAKANLITALPYNASYYLTMKVKTGSVENGAFNIGYRDGKNDFFQMAKNGYYSVGTDGSWENKSFIDLLDGMRITYYSSPTEFKIWIDGERIIDESYANDGTAFPGITWVKELTEVTDICIWTKEAIAKETPVFDTTTQVMRDVKNLGQGIVKADDSLYFDTDLDSSDAYYMSMTVQTEGSLNINYRYPNGMFQMNKSEYNSVGTGSGYVSKSFAKLDTGIEVVIYSATDWITIWINGQKIIDEAYQAVGEAKPGISWCNKDVKISDVRIWTDVSENSEFLGVIEDTARQSLSEIKEYGVSLNSLKQTVKFVDKQPVGKNVPKAVTLAQDGVYEVMASDVKHYEEKDGIQKVMVPLGIAITFIVFALIQLCGTRRKNESQED